jgi:predicted nucleic acid-binding protein
MENFYLDTNILFGYFVKKALERRGKRIESKVADFLVISSKNLKYAVSILTKAEIVRKLKSEYGLDKNIIEEMWNGFVLEISPLYVKVSQSLEEIYEEIINIVNRVPMKKRVTNLEHLIIAKKNNLILVTGDKEIVEKCKVFYDKIIGYKKLRKIYENQFKNEGER